VPPRYTVLLPTHNRADAVGHAIASVLAQTERDFELLVVGDGCTDDTATVVRSFDDARLRWFDLPKAPNFGYANRNLALREAQGELVAFMAHDDLLLTDHLARMAEPFADDGVEWAYSRPLWVADDGRIVPFAVDLRIAEQRHVFVTDHNSIPASCVVYRRRLHQRIGMWPEEIAGSGDWEMWKRMIDPSRGANLAYVPEPTTLHFRADWRPTDAWGPPPLHAWLVVASADAWPDALRFEIPDGVTAQAAAAARLSAEWTQELRAAIAAAMDVLAWTTAADRSDDHDFAARAVDAARVADAARIADAESRAATAERRAAVVEALVSAAEARAAGAEARAADAEARATTAEAQAKTAGSRLAAAETRAAVAEARATVADSRLATAESRAAIAEARLAGADARLAPDATGSSVRRRPSASTLSRAFRRIRLALRGNPLFDARWYSDEYGDVTPARAARHWRRHGLRMGRRPNRHFDAAAYLERYPDVRTSRMNPLDHFYIYGASEARSADGPSETSG
jgi:Glycosyl transferase family 2